VREAIAASVARALSHRAQVSAWTRLQPADRAAQVSALESSAIFPRAPTTPPPYCIQLPPPTSPHPTHGHAFQQTLMDALIRYHRMPAATPTGVRYIPSGIFRISLYTYFVSYSTIQYDAVHTLPQL